MIVFNLACRDGGHRFEGWFGSSDDYAAQAARGLVTCPVCGSGAIDKAPTAPRLARKANQRGDAPVTVPGKPATPAAVPAAPPVAATPAMAPPPPLPPEARAMLETIARVQAEALKTSTWVGEQFADKARAMHYGEADAAPIHGRVTPEQAHDLLDEGVTVAPLIVPFVPPGEAN